MAESNVFVDTLEKCLNIYISFSYFLHPGSLLFLPYRVSRVAPPLLRDISSYYGQIWTDRHIYVYVAKFSLLLRGKRNSFPVAYVHTKSVAGDRRGTDWGQDRAGRIAKSRAAERSPRGSGTSEGAFERRIRELFESYVRRAAIAIGTRTVFSPPGPRSPSAK